MKNRDGVEVRAEWWIRGAESGRAGPGRCAKLRYGAGVRGAGYLLHKYFRGRLWKFCSPITVVRKVAGEDVFADETEDREYTWRCCIDMNPPILSTR